MMTTTYWDYPLQQYQLALERVGIKIISSAEGEQISLDEALMHLRHDLDGGSPLPERDWIEGAIVAAREMVEHQTGLLLKPHVVELSLNGFPSSTGISVVTGPFLGLTSVSYFDSDNVEQPVDSSTYLVDDYVQPAIISAASGTSWPSVSGNRGSVRVRCAVGYNLPSDSPQDQPLPKVLKHAMYLVLAHLYENRENTTDLKLELLPMGVAALCERHRIRTSMA